MKIPSFKKFHKHRGIYENNIMEPVGDLSIETEEEDDIYSPQSQAQMGTTTKPVTPTKPLTKPVQPGTQNPNQQPTITPAKAQAQAQMGTTTKPVTPTKPLTQPVPPGTQNPNQQPTVTPVKAQSQAQAQGRYSQAQAQAPRPSSSMDYQSSLPELAKLLGGNFLGNSVEYSVTDEQGKEVKKKIEQASENGHFFIDQIDLKTTDPVEAKKKIDQMFSGRGAQMNRDRAQSSQNWKETQASQMTQEPKMIGERRSNKKNFKNRLNELTENPYMKSGGMTNIGGGHTGDTRELLNKSREVSAMEPIDKYLHFINELSNTKVDKDSVEMILHNCYIELSKVK